MNYLKQFQYNEQIIGRFIDALIQEPNSSDQIKRQLSHVLNALELWVSRVEEREPTVQVWDVHPPSKLHEMNRRCHQQIFRLLESSNLHKPHKYQNTKGEDFTNTLDEILTHLIIHSAHHRAQIASLWRAENVEPPVSDFIFWAREFSRP